MSSSYPYPTVQIAVSHNTGWRKVRPDLCQMDAGGTNTNASKHHDLAYFAHFTNTMSCFTNRKRSSMTLCIACMLRSIPSRTCMLKPGHCLHSHTPRIMERPQAKRRRENETLKSLLADKSISLKSLERLLPKLRDDTPADTSFYQPIRRDWNTLLSLRPCWIRKEIQSTGTSVVHLSSYSTWSTSAPVSYTHLTLPTKRIV